MSALPQLLDCPALVAEAPAAVVYVLDTDQGVKVGITVSLRDRIRGLSAESGVPVDAIRVVRTYPCTSRQQARTIERCSHWHLRDTKRQNEWFHCHPLEATAAVERALRRPVPIEMLRAGFVR